MSVIVTDTGFAQDNFTGQPVALTDVASNGPVPAAVIIAPADDPARLAGRFDGVALITVEFPSFADGRGFTHARALRGLGYTGRLRATGHVIADQYAMARRSGFDEVQISDDLAARQPEAQWLARADWQDHDYQSRLRARATALTPFLDPLHRLSRRAAHCGRHDPYDRAKTCDDASATPVSRAIPTLPDAQTVTSVRHYTDRLFAFRVTRPASLRFRSGEFVMIGLMGDNGRPLLRAYSIASPAWDDELEFYSIKVPDGPLTSKLQHIQPGDEIILRPKPVGTLVHDAILPGKRLYFFATGTGFAPFASLLREPQTYEDYDEIIMTHTCRDVAELTYGRDLIEGLKTDELMIELLGEENLNKLRYYPTTTREESPKMGRITTLIENGELFGDLGVPALSPETDRAMVCGSLEFNKDIKALLEAAGLEEGANSDPKQFVIEKAFVG